jgi:hypothetical protein
MTTVTAEKKMGTPIVDFAMTPEEAEELRLAIESTLGDLHTEIAHTDRYEFREMLKKRRTILRGVLRRLSAPPIKAHERQTEAQ